MKILGGFLFAQNMFIFNHMKTATLITFLVSTILSITLPVEGKTETTKIGLAAYGALNEGFPCDYLMRGFKDLPTLNLSILWNTFGKDFSCLNTWASDTRPKFLQIHLVNEVCQRNNRCGKYELLNDVSPDDFSRMLSEDNFSLRVLLPSYFSEITAWLESHPSVECNISPSLESNLSKKNFNKLLDMMKGRFPARCSITWNPVNNNKFGNGPLKSQNILHELHGPSHFPQAPCIANLDGVDISLKTRESFLVENISYLEVPTYLSGTSHCKAVFLWIAEFNGIAPGPFIDPRKRTNWPSEAIMIELNDLLKRGEAKKAISIPAWDQEDDKSLLGCSKLISPKDGEKKGFLWKQSDVPSYGAVALFPQKDRFKKVEVFKAGKLIEKLSYAYQYTEDKSNRQVWRAKRKAKNFPFNVVLKTDSVCYKLKNPQIRVD